MVAQRRRRSGIDRRIDRPGIVPGIGAPPGEPLRCQAAVTWLRGLSLQLIELQVTRSLAFYSIGPLAKHGVFFFIFFF